jgi:hypothetical protein
VLTIEPLSQPQSFKPQGCALLRASAFNRAARAIDHLNKMAHAINAKASGKTAGETSHSAIPSYAIHLRARYIPSR